MIISFFTELLKKSEPSRIVHVSSFMHLFGRLDLENMNCEKGSNGFMVYNTSKLYNVIGSNEFSRRLEGSGKALSNSINIIRHCYPILLYLQITLIILNY